MSAHEGSGDGYPGPPIDFEDAADRSIAIRCHGDGPVEDEIEALVATYEDFDPADRAQGLPPGREPALREWLEMLLSNGAVNVIAWHGSVAAGHATLVPDHREQIDHGGPAHETAYELAIFVHQDYQSAGIGSRLIRSLLGTARDHGVERIWLTVERWNEPAIALYRGVGFETASTERFEMEMELELGKGSGSKDGP